ncbi:MAG TPA: hypothetical protein VFJ95_08645, partial [Gammaproteobacteria bacterium]|nr:hypothetical protein [Gammaproteobacteria bacterium]
MRLSDGDVGLRGSHVAVAETPADQGRAAPATPPPAKSAPSAPSAGEQVADEQAIDEEPIAPPGVSGHTADTGSATPSIAWFPPNELQAAATDLPNRRADDSSGRRAAAD